MILELERAKQDQMMEDSRAKKKMEPREDEQTPTPRRREDKGLSEKQNLI